MTLSENAAYLKGLAEGMKLSKETDEGRMIHEITAFLCEAAEAISDLQENALAVSDELDEIEEDLDAIEEFLMDEDEDEDDYDLDDDDDYAYDDEDAVYEVDCPKCGEHMELDEDTILGGSIKCPKCGELLEFEFDEDDEEDDEDGPIEF